jgi:hypothetical protein
VWIDHDLENTPLEIKTDSKLGSGDITYVQFRDSQGSNAGGFAIKFDSPPTNWIEYCNEGWTNFPTDLPKAKNKVWRITITRISGIRLIVHCNEKEVLNHLMSQCHYSDWENFNEVAKILFHPSLNTATDNWRPMIGK